MRNSPSITVLIFWLILAGLAAVYYKGVSTDIRAVSMGASSIIGGLQLRDPVTGDFENYPT